jgi:5-methylcytosine-specific restriction endonuclease McrA
VSLARIKRLAPIGKRAFLPPTTKTSPGRCTWCLEWNAQLDRDHVLPRSLFPGPLRDHPRNLVPACRRCNRRRAHGWKASFSLLPKRVQEFALAQWRPARLERHFTDVPEPA